MLHHSSFSQFSRYILIGELGVKNVVPFTKTLVSWKKNKQQQQQQQQQQTKYVNIYA